MNQIKSTVEETRVAYAAMSRIFDEVKLSEDTTWAVARMLRKMKPSVKDFEMAQSKMYRDAGGQVTGQGVMLLGIERKKEESDEDWARRKEEYRNTVNGLHESVERLLAKEVEINLAPIKRSELPKDRKNERGEKEEVLYRATDIASAWPFLVDDKEVAEESQKE